jgi:adenylate kinase family enzyme
MRLLITGIPGTGKTRFGEYLVSAHRFVHRDLEDTHEFAKCVASPANYLRELAAEGQRRVITWGFVPVPDQIEVVRSIRKHGFGIIWFDGDRPAALRAFQKRGTTPEMNFYLQMYRIESKKAFESVGPIPINSFDERGEFKDPAIIFDEIKSAVARSSVPCST